MWKGYELSNDEAVMENWNGAPTVPMVSFGSLDTQEVSLPVAARMLTWLRDHNPQVFSDALIYGLAGLEPSEMARRRGHRSGAQS